MKNHPPPVGRPTWQIDSADDQDLRVARRRIIVTSLVAAAVLTGVAALAVESVATDRAEDGARARGGVVATVVAASLDTGPGTVPNEVVDRVTAEQNIDHVIVWQADGTVSWSEDGALIGGTFTMDEELQDLFVESGSVVSRASSDLESADAPADAAGDFEVFTASQVGETDVVIETYVDRSVLTDERRHTLGVLLPYVVAAIVLLEGSCLLLGWLMLREVRRARHRRVWLTGAAVRAMDVERRELAHQLHDGIVQDLAATRYALASIADSLEPSQRGEPREKLDRVQEVLGEELVDLRGLLGHLVPIDLESRSLEQALRALVRHLVPSETRCLLEVHTPDLHPVEAGIVYRVVREGVTNAVRHAQPGTIHITVGCERLDPDQTDVVVRVEDDGHGLRDETTGADRGSGEGHFGLTLLGSLIADHGGRLTLSPGPSAGAVLLVRMPVGRGSERGVGGPVRPVTSVR